MVGIVFIVLIYSLGLGIVHGITPDDHTWPITFSYAIGSFSAKKGFYVGFLFSLAFAIQRAIASEIAYFALIKWSDIAYLNYYLYIVIGLIMLFTGMYVLRFNRIFHIEILPASWIGKKDRHEIDTDPRTPTPKMALLHGFIAGWGFGSFALILYTVLVPRMPSFYLAFLPGLFFGIGTMLVQAAFGYIFGRWIRSMKISEKQGLRLASIVSGDTLFGGGIVFILGGLLGLIFPNIANLAIITPSNVGNLNELGLAFVMVVATVLFIGLGSMFYHVHKLQEEYGKK